MHADAKALPDRAAVAVGGDGELLLVAFDALLAERSVTRAANRLGLSQPGMSNALARLRKLFGDPLLVREGMTLVPTPRADSLAEPVRARWPSPSKPWTSDRASTQAPITRRLPSAAPTTACSSGRWSGGSPPPRPG